VADILDRALAKNRSLRVLMACGYFDLDTPYFGTRYTVNHFNQDPALLKRVVITYYDAGHQIYTHAPSLKKLKKDVAAFFEASLRE
jgi:carboxypeptidase C (cathepsin A)